MSLIEKYGIKGMHDEDLKAMIKLHAKNKKLVELCKRQLTQNFFSGR